jgi:16S rRNA (guanine1207-N2)-methyltransferase
VLEDHDRVAPAAELCARLITPAPDEQTLLFGASHGALGVALARLLPRGRVLLSDPNVVALQAARATLAANDVPNAAVFPYPIGRLLQHAGAFDRVVLVGPQSRALARRWLVEAHVLLRPGGTLTITGAKHQGVQSLIADATALFGSSSVLGYGGGCRVAETIRRIEPPPAPTWVSEPGIAPGTWIELTADLPAGPTRLVSLPGVFSADRLDPGTALLLAHLPNLRGARVLDIGCGYGPIGVAAGQLGAAHVTMHDVNTLAVAAAAENCARHSVPATVRAAAGITGAGGPVDVILSNPPFHAGKRTQTAPAEAFLLEALTLLASGGQLLCVANSFLGYASSLAANGVAVRIVADNRRYQVLQVGG